ncbi:PAS domain-containing sensor histidine kinase [Amycolatopsis sp. CA-230715]|uniref:PAS domain-containing sensor histidine kinase n=1 Tax=Amycolatopsis sp. CA-230715 TaxID=2745196 RepID=UPI001C0348E9|nr:PAS domain-containing sensor histidine kinase [Amycolatopsis sp. CA-230715]QWF85234.1 hypothetical protein HUW46_08688 [Amycolatopsis sp. CA-230715]
MTTMELDRDHPTPEDAEFRLLVEAVLDYGIFMLDPTGVIVSWNAGAQRIKGYTAAEIIGRHFSVFYPAEDNAAGKPDRELRIAEAEGRLEDEGWRVRQDGSRFWANVVITALFGDDGRLRGFGKVTRDMTERRNAERVLSERRQLLRHLVDAQEAERRRIAWDVHDDAIQAMVSVGMRLELLAGRLSREQAAEIGTVDDVVGEAVKRLRDLVSQLRPAALDQLGLGNAITAYLDDVVADWNLTYAFRNDLIGEPPRECAITVFRICQEALANVRKHAKASTVAIELSTVDQGVLARVRDDGIGMEVGAAWTKQGHFGMIEMRERAETAEGWWTVASTPGQGTTVEFWLPATPEPQP